MDFRKHQDIAKKNSRIIWVLYIVLLLISSVLIGYTLMISMNLLELYQPQYQQYSFGQKFIFANRYLFNKELVQLTLFLWVCAFAFATMLIITLFGFMQKSNGHKVALAFGGVLLSEDNKLSREEKRALNIVAEQALAANIKTPSLYLIPDEAINAFAAGKKTDEAVIAITNGSLNSFNRTQLSAVVAHEIGHIVNQDIKLNIQIYALVFGFTALFFVARLIFYNAIYNRRMNGRAKIIMIVAALVVAIIGALTVWFGRILQAAMSRQREYLADAQAVQFTRYPEGLIETFEIMQGKDKKQSTLKSAHAMEYAHAMMFGMKGQLFATHPSLDNRIARIKNSN